MSARIVDPLPRGVSPALVEQAEWAGLRASQPPEQFELDGWLLRRLPGKAKRARCVNALHAGERSLDDKLAECARLYGSVGVPLFIRITPFSAPPGLDEALAARAWRVHDETRVLVHPVLADVPAREVPEGLVEEPVDAQGYAAAVGALRGSTALEIASHALRLQVSPVPYQGCLWRQASPSGHPAGGPVLACAQVAREGELAGLYDVYTATAARGRGLSTALCARMLRQSHAQGARRGYLQVDAENHAALTVYRRLGFVEAYGYHYRLSPADEASAH